ncbi:MULTISPECIES: DUF6908 domain-containing protein [unclassified Tenacibaculum]|uniref:DUF6908 domain-containing protein n=1 Tax=unclassified Tenacibaculum TaxID=2635139 RepID=UPI001F34134C|nr:MULTISPECIES: hypothetical protein [unclassified Tenacibaculum]MCF2876524.1 hypothetical protein [Tenacibaculum sp. Cn5-1]MCF2936569.1 hypothetical protein [Tenacibaculum sp. Cn5-34]MCG7511838.1 hypothetical protein [Tenacibaculum sp. Cn5-46]
MFKISYLQLLSFSRNPNGNYSFAHYGKLNGDLMADPEMCFLLIQNKSDNVIFPYSYKNDYMGFNTVISPFENGSIKECNKRMLHSHISFANMWLRNIKEAKKNSFRTLKFFK